MLGRRALGALAAGVLPLLASACGSPAPPAFHPAGTTTPAPSPSASLAHFPFPPDVHIEFQSPLPTDPQQAAAVITDRNFQLAWYYALYTVGKQVRFAPYISSRSELTHAEISLAQGTSDHLSFTGTLRFFDTTVQPAAGIPADLAVTSCGDNSRLLNTEPGTRKVVPDTTTPPDQHYFLQRDTYAPAGNGKWGLVADKVSFYPDGNAKECKP